MGQRWFRVVPTSLAVYHKSCIGPMLVKRCADTVGNKSEIIHWANVGSELNRYHKSYIGPMLVKSCSDTVGDMSIIIHWANVGSESRVGDIINCTLGCWLRMCTDTVGEISEIILYWANLQSAKLNVRSVCVLLIYTGPTLVQHCSDTVGDMHN